MHVIRRAVRTALPAPIARSLHRLAVSRRTRSFESRTVTHSYMGERLRVSLEDPLADGWYDHDWGQQAEIEALRRGRLRPGARVFDLGAHQAIVALVLARIVGEAGEVVAVEAERHNVRVAKENVRLNSATNLRLVHAAAADSPGRLFFSESLNGSVVPGGRGGKVEVAAVTVDDLAERFGAPDVVFIDVEGYEAKVLVGAARTVEARSTDFFVEIHDATTLAQMGTNASEVIEAFVKTGYRCDVAAATSDGIAGDWSQARSGDYLGGGRGYLIATALKTSPCAEQ